MLLTALLLLYYLQAFTIAVATTHGGSRGVAVSTLFHQCIAILTPRLARRLRGSSRGGRWVGGAALSHYFLFFFI